MVIEKNGYLSFRGRRVVANADSDATQKTAYIEDKIS